MKITVASYHHEVFRIEAFEKVSGVLDASTFDDKLFLFEDASDEFVLALQEDVKDFEQLELRVVGSHFAHFVKDELRRLLVNLC